MDNVGLPSHELIRLKSLATGTSRADVITSGEMSPANRRLLDQLVARRIAGEPLQYIEGTAAFGPIEVAVDERVLIPRPETEQVWERAMELLGGGRRVVDVGTGSGCIALATKYLRPDTTVIGVDVSPSAVAVAAANADRLALDVTFVCGDLLSSLMALVGRVDLIVTNPPYVEAEEWATLAPEVKDHEPAAALIGGVDGLDVYRRLAAEASVWLAPDGVLVGEIGAAQGAAVGEMFSRNGWRAVVEQDLTGRDRILVARPT